MLRLDKHNLPQLTDRISRYIKSHRVYAKGSKIKGTQSFVYNVPIAFDTETTNYTTDDGSKVGWMYIWMFRFGSPSDPDSIAIYGREIGLLDEFLTALSERLSLSVDRENERLLIVYVQNLGFDFEFIREILTINYDLHSNTHQPIFIRDVRGIEFRDSKILSGGLSLKKIGESLKSDFSKKVGDLDYNLIRAPDTPLTKTELGYCVGDIDVLSAYIDEQIEQYNGIQHIPLTNTGRVRKYARDRIYKSGSYGSYRRYRDLMERCQLTFEEYEQCQRAFYGGYTHANIDYVGMTLKDVESYDFTSSYPAVMLSERFPMGKPEHVDNMTFEELRDIVNDPNRCAIFDLQLGDVFVKDSVGDSYLSNDATKVTMVNPIVDNGRVRSCDKIALTCTDVDFKIISKCYSWERIHISNVLVWETDYLPTQLLDVVLDLYNAKTTLKGVPEKIEEYNVKKGMLNSLYGMCVTRILRDRVTVNDSGWSTIELTDEEKHENIDKNNASKTRFLYYPWGVFITAYARFNLWTAIVTLGKDYIYADTDSIKVFAGSVRLKEYLTKYHQDLQTKFEWMLEFKGKLSIDQLKPKTKDGIEKPIGVWDFEGKYTHFKTLGAKRYIKADSESGKIETTVSGIIPKNLSNFLKETNDSIESVFNAFDDGLHVPENRTGKLASIYYDNVSLDVTDYLGHTSHVEQRHGVHLTPVDFTLTMDGSFIDLIKRLREEF